ncbi:HAMP domain-containing protein [Rhodoferax sp. 4810]|uniref:HAMP domain-containing protein n=1 Tax=Thiospirillum jenense TaxID=1653858 RepID=A0A839HM20_9GAMM|nr:methyl-accepting chemotaxis protein [Thiospirillum jenense]MBB1074794.1 HAMP domain-containing protein [Rhodoferax jenense]MBB1126632.1 HAMP domain-containing protein [Thiospirillum jenense]
MLLTIGRKLGLAFAIALLFVIGVGIVGWFGIERIVTAQLLARHHFEQALFQAHKEVDHLVWINHLGNALLLGERFDGALDPLKCDFGRWYQQFAESSDLPNASPDFRRTFAAIEAPHRRLHESAKQVLTTLQAGDHAQAVAFYRTDTLPALEQVRDLLAELSRILQAEQNQVLTDAGQVANVARWSLVIGTLIAFLMAIGVGAGLKRAIVLPVNAATERLQAIASGDGDLTQRLISGVPDEFGALAQAFNHFADRIHALVKQVTGASNQLSTAAEELSASSTHTRQQVRERQAEIAQVAQAMAQMAASVQQVAHHAAAAAQATAGSDVAAKSGGEEIVRVITAIESLAKQVESTADLIGKLSLDSDEIGNVLDVIRGIAEQTNLLALNAAIEAARAGEQGRGFAVVADEVRTLASRTQTSTVEVRQIIERLQSRAASAVQAMEQGRGQARDAVNKASQAGDSLRAIMGAVGSMSGMTAEIASAAEQQSSVAVQINQNVLNIDRGVEQIAQSSDEIAAASGELARLAGDLQNRVGRFRV